MMTLRTFAVAAAVSLTSLPAFAFDDTDKAALAALTEKYAVAMATNDYATMVASQPPAVYQELADQTGATVDELKTAIIDGGPAQAGENGFSDIAMSFDLDAAETGTSTEGRDYALIPNDLTYKMDGTAFRDTGSVLAVKEGDAWYLLQMKDPIMIDAAFAAYPDLAWLEPAEPTTTELQ